MTKKKTNKWNNRLQNAFYIGTLASLIFIMLQAYYARQSAIRASEWEKAKMTIENIERFRENISASPLFDNNVWMLGSRLWADASTTKGYELTDTLRGVYLSLFDNEIDALNDAVRMIETMDAFAFPIIMGYASEMGSFQTVMREFHSLSGFLMPVNFHEISAIGLHARFLYRLWRIRFEIMIVDDALESWSDDIINLFEQEREHLLSFEGEFSEASLKRYRRQLDKKLRDVQREIRDFRRNSLR